MGWWDDLLATIDSSEKIVGSTVKIGDSLKNLAFAIKELDDRNSDYLRGAEKQIAINQEINAQYIEAAKQTLVLERRNAQINKTFGVGVKQAAMLSQKFQQVAVSLSKNDKQYQITGVQAAKYGGSIRKMVPTLNQFAAAGTDMYKSLQQTQHILQTNIGLTEDQTNKYTQYAEQNGKSSSSMLLATKRLADSLDPEGTMGYFKMITEEIATAGEEIQLQYGKIPGNLEVAVLKAKKLGFTLEDLSGTADNLLEIESSIGQELEYQLLSGRRLVDNQGASLTNMYREAALRGDMNKQADIMNNILETEGETIENNMFARKQLAATLGIEERQLASALQKKKILDKAAAAGIDINIDGSDSAKALAAAADAVREGAISDQDYQELVKASDTRTTDDILKQQLEVMQESYIIDMLQYQQSTKVKDNQQALLSDNKDFLVDLQSSFVAIGEARRSLAATTGVSTAFTNIKSGTTKPYEITTEEDAVITPGYGKRVLSFPEDTLQAPIAFNDNDTIVAGTNLAGKGGSAGSADISQFATMIVAAINNQTRALKSDATFGGGLNAPYYG